MDDEKRYCTIEESIVEACKEVNLMRKGLKPKRTLDELWEKLDEELAEENIYGRRETLLHNRRINHSGL